MKKVLLLISILFLIVGITQVSPGTAMAQSWTGNFSDHFNDGLMFWFWQGDVGTTPDRVARGEAAYLLTSYMSVRNMCSFLYSVPIYPEYEPLYIEVSFKVSYRTDEHPAYGPYPDMFREDPFTAELMNIRGTVDLATIKVDGVTPGPYATVQIIDTGKFLTAPARTPLRCTILGSETENGDGYRFMCKTKPLLVSSRMPYTSCEPVVLKFSICDSWDFCGRSGAYIDDVSVRFNLKSNPTPVRCNVEK